MSKKPKLAAYLGLNRGNTGRADMLHALIHGSSCDLAVVAQCVGYTARLSATAAKPPSQSAPNVLNEQPVTSMPTTVTGEPAEALTFIQLHQYDSIAPDQAVREAPTWFDAASALKPEDDEVCNKKIPTRKPPLMRWSRLWPFLKIVLGVLRDSHRLDERKLMRDVAQGVLLTRLPYRQTQVWAPEVRIVVDYSPRLLPFWHDFNRLCRALQVLHGHAGLTIVPVQAAPDAGLDTQTPTLVLSDLGFYASDRRIAAAWGRWAQRLGTRPVVLTPCPTRLWDPKVLQQVFAVCWDKTTRLPRQLKGQPPVRRQPEHWDGGDNGVGLLLAMLSPAIRVEPDLLRALRCRLPPQQVDVGCEAEAWQHAHTHSTPLAFAFDKKTIEQYQQQFKAQDNTLQQKAIATILEYHASLPTAITDEEQRNMAILCGKAPDESLMQQVVKTLFNDDFTDIDALRAWVGRFGQRQQPDRWESEVATAAWMKAHQQALHAGEVNLPNGLELRRAAWVLDATGETQTYHIRQQGRALRLLKNPGEHTLLIGSRVGEIRCSRPQLEISTGQTYDCVTITQEPKVVMPASGDLMLTTDLDCLVLQQQPKPAWATSTGMDQFGWFAQFKVNDVRQTMRWINPGEFMMGSPESEEGRISDELLHPVKLTQGFWLADTACTQALWKAVMEQNPSKFIDDDKPVENVSWLNVETFIDRLNQAAPGLAVVLPTEAQWEYACRAGTHSAFAFGHAVNRQQVNCGAKSTVLVKSLPPNAWGLHQMHGNVWEWCSDCYARDYVNRLQVYPQRRSGISERVLRGGGCFDDAGYVRSAVRISDSPRSYGVSIGFRLARGQ